MPPNFLLLTGHKFTMIIYMLGFPILGVEWQKMENPDLRVAMGMKPEQKGVRIRRVDPTSPEFAVLKPSDVILSFDGVNIANDGTGEAVLAQPQHIAAKKKKKKKTF